MTPIFKLLPGAPIGSGGGLVARGQQWMSWIHIDDIVGLFQLAVENAAGQRPDQRHGAPPGAECRVLQDPLERAPEALHALARLHPDRPARRAAFD